MAKLELVGIEALLERVNKLVAVSDEIKAAALSEAAELVKASMAANAPRSRLSKPHMADYIQISPMEKVNGVESVRIGPIKGGGTEFYYSKFTEWGTTKIPAMHWASRSLEENRRKIQAIIRETLERRLRELSE